MPEISCVIVQREGPGHGHETHIHSSSVNRDKAAAGTLVINPADERGLISFI